MTRALVITNPFAARAHAQAVTEIVKILGRGGWNVDLRTIKGPGDARRIAEESLGEGFDVLVSHGGDGTAMQVAAGIAGSGIALGVVPGGTGNVLAGNLHLPRTTKDAARALLHARSHAIDLGVVQRQDGAHYFAVVAGTGFDAQLMAGTGREQKRRWKFAAYIARAALTLPAVHSVPHRVTLDDTAADIRAAMLLVLNCGKLPPAFLNLRETLAPDDGWFDIVALDADGAIQSVQAVLEMLFRSNGTSKLKRVWWGRGRTVRVELIEGLPRPVQLDGEVTGATPFEARLLPGALSVLVGPEFRGHGGHNG
ncbi:MAG TPA: diacylglycerol kinase family protein [Gemmatimonadales bacterium]|nr:diacylglycerol kinase family protein [Gemmatimonadales bacterium]